MRDLVAALVCSAGWRERLALFVGLLASCDLVVFVEQVIDGCIRHDMARSEYAWRNRITPFLSS
jgi:hypothetical protein